MKKVLLSVAVAMFMIVATHNEASAQFSVAGGVLMPQGDWGDIWGTGFGGQVSYKKENSNGMKIGGTVGFYSIPGDEIDILGSPFSYPDATLIPILATLDYPMGDSFYVGADAGYNVISFSGGGSVTAAGSSAALIPKAGAMFGPVNVEGRFNVIGDSYLSFIVGFTFGQ